MDKVVFCLCIWSFLCFVDYTSGNPLINLVVVLTCALLFGLECAIATVRTADYFTAKLAPPTDDDKKPALRAVSEGKLKQKFESCGIALYCLALPNPTTGIISTLAGSL